VLCGLPLSDSLVAPFTVLNRLFGRCCLQLVLACNSFRYIKALYRICLEDARNMVTESDRLHLDHKLQLTQVLSGFQRRSLACVLSLRFVCSPAACRHMPNPHGPLALASWQLKIRQRMSQYSAVVFLFVSGSFVWSFMLLAITLLRHKSNTNYNAFLICES
jgi:hypothetical protein